MNESDKRMDKELDRLLAYVRAETSPLPTPDPSIPARVRAISVVPRKDMAVHGQHRRWLFTSLAVAALVLVAGAGAYVGFGAATHSPTKQQSNDADLFIAALSQSGFGDEIGRLQSEER